MFSHAISEESQSESWHPTTRCNVPLQSPLLALIIIANSQIAEYLLMTMTLLPSIKDLEIQESLGIVHRTDIRSAVYSLQLVLSWSQIDYQ